MGNGALPGTSAVFFSCELPCSSFHNQQAEGNEGVSPAEVPCTACLTATAGQTDPGAGEAGRGSRQHLRQRGATGPAAPGAQHCAEPAWGDASRALHSGRTRTTPPKTSRE